MSETETDQKLQFEKAEFEGTKTTAKCSICHNPLSGSYFTVNMQSTCPSCADNLRQHFGRQVAAVILSGDTSAAAIANARRAGIPLLHKPVRPARLRALLQRKTQA